MPFDNKNLFKPIEVTVDPWQVVTGTISTSTSNTAYVYTPSVKLPEVKEVIFAPPATIVYWKDGSRTVVKCNESDVFNEEVGFALCFLKKVLQNAGYVYNFNTYIRKNIKNAKRYGGSIPLSETSAINIPDIIPELTKKLNEILMPQHGMDKGSL